MKKKWNILFIWATLMLNGISADAHNAKYYMYIPNKQNVPVGVTVPTALGFVFILKSDKHPDFATAINRYYPTAFEQAFPNAVTDWLRDVYQIECDSIYMESDGLYSDNQKKNKYSMPFDRMITSRFKKIVPLITKLGTPRIPEDPTEIEGFYFPLLNETNRWNNLKERHEEGKWTYIYQLEGDTLIDGRKYRKLYHTVDKQAKNWHKRGYLYEDIGQKKVWYRPAWGDRDRLLYNFDVAEKDTFYTMGRIFYSLETPNTVDWNYDSIRHIVKKVDTVKISHKDHRRITLESTLITPLGSYHRSFENVWIEGIGSTNGLFSLYLYLPGSPSEELLAFYQDDKLIYQSPKYDNVFIWETVGNKLIRNDTQVFVLPDGRTLHIGDEGTNRSVRVYSMHGTEVFRQTVAPYTTTLALPAIPSGVYIITVRSEGKSISQKIVVK